MPGVCNVISRGTGLTTFLADLSPRPPKDDSLTLGLLTVTGITAPVNPFWVPNWLKLPDLSLDCFIIYLLVGPHFPLDCFIVCSSTFIPLSLAGPDIEISSDCFVVSVSTFIPLTLVGSDLDFSPDCSPVCLCTFIALSLAGPVLDFSSDCFIVCLHSSILLSLACPGFPNICCCFGTVTDWTVGNPSVARGGVSKTIMSS